MLRNMAKHDRVEPLRARLLMKNPSTPRHQRARIVAMNPARTSLPLEILRYYEAGKEAGRLETDSFRWEKVRTLDLMSRFLPPPPAVILDVGGGAGAYAFPLAEQGYSVHLIDPVPLHIEQAKERAKAAAAAPQRFQVGDARS